MAASTTSAESIRALRPCGALPDHRSVARIDGAANMRTSANVDGLSKVCGMPLAARCDSIAACQRRTEATPSLRALGGRQLHEVWQAHFGGDVDEALLELHLLQAAAERQERYLDTNERPPHAVAVGEVAHHHLQRERCTSIVDQHVTSLASVSHQRSRRLATGAERRGNTPGHATTGSDYQSLLASRSSMWTLRRPSEKLASAIESRAVPRWFRTPRYLVPVIVACALFMENMDATVIATALPTIAHDFGESPLALNLAITCYLLSLGIFLPLSGWLADRLGARTVFSSAIVVFTLGSIGCSLVESLPQLVLARVVQGMGGAMMVPVGRLVVLRTIPKAELVSAMAYLHRARADRAR